MTFNVYTHQNSVTIPLKYLEYYLKSLTQNEFKVLMCIVKNHFFYKQKITITEIKEISRISRGSVQICVNLLEAEGLVKKTYQHIPEKKAADRYFYEINGL